MYLSILCHIILVVITPARFMVKAREALKLAKANEQFFSAFSDLGALEVVCEATVNKLDLFTCQLFGDQTARTVNEARYNLFTKGKFGEDCLPPNKDALLLHKRRANYVIHLAQIYTYPTINAPDFRNHGWFVTKKINSSDKIFVFEDKTRNIYETSLDT